MNLADRINQTQEREGINRERYALGDHIGLPCPVCMRARLCKCPNGKHRCEKCDWIVEDNRRYSDDM